jgi:hypothetical protein
MAKKMQRCWRNLCHLELNLSLYINLTQTVNSWTCNLNKTWNVDQVFRIFDIDFKVMGESWRISMFFLSIPHPDCRNSYRINSTFYLQHTSPNRFIKIGQQFRKDNILSWFWLSCCFNYCFFISMSRTKYFLEFF